MNENLKYLLALNRHPKLGSARLLYLKKIFRNCWQDAYFLKIKTKIDPSIAVVVREAQKQFDPDREIKIIKQVNLKIAILDDNEYPDSLRQLPDPPVVLYYRGKLDCLNSVCIAVVGCRRASSYGAMMAERIVSRLVLSGATIVSGLALGIDSAAHRAAMDNDGKTVAVQAGGLDEIYPPSNRYLAQKIVDSGGAIISENPPGYRAQKFAFPVRNRIIAGLCAATLVVEAMEKSGALLTAAAALDYNKDVFAVPGDATREQAVGSNNLIKLGAKPVTSAEDILEELNLPQKIAQSKARQDISASPEEMRVLEYLAGEAIYIDELVKLVKMDIAGLTSTLTLLEIKGRVKNLGGGNYIKS